MKLHFLPVILFQKQFLKNSCAFLNSERPALLPVQLNKLVYFWARRYEAATAFKEVRISQKHTALTGFAHSTHLPGGKADCICRDQPPH